MKPSIQFLELIAHHPEKLFENYINKEINRRKNMVSILNYVIDDESNKSNKNNKNNDNNELILVKKKNIKPDNELTIDELDKLLEEQNNKDNKDNKDNKNKPKMTNEELDAELDKFFTTDEINTNIQKPKKIIRKKKELPVRNTNKPSLTIEL